MALWWQWVKAISEALFALRHGEQEILQSGGTSYGLTHSIITLAHSSLIAVFSLSHAENIHFPASPRSRRAVQYRAPPIPNTVILVRSMLNNGVELESYWSRARLAHSLTTRTQSPLSSPREEHVPSVRVSTYDHFAEIDQEAAQFELRVPLPACLLINAASSIAHVYAGCAAP